MAKEIFLASFNQDIFPIVLATGFSYEATKKLAIETLKKSQTHRFTSTNNPNMPPEKIGVEITNEIDLSSFKFKKFKKGLVLHLFYFEKILVLNLYSNTNIKRKIRYSIRFERIPFAEAE